MASDDTNKIAARYAKALFVLADKATALTPVEKDLQAISRLLAQSAELSRALTSPLLPRAAKASITDALLKRLRAHDLTLRFAHQLAMAGRLAAIGDIVEEFENLMIAHRGELVLEVITATPISSATGVADALSKAYGRKVQVRTSVDKSLIGGIVIKAGSTMMDYSLKSRLNRLSRALKTQAA